MSIFGRMGRRGRFPGAPSLAGVPFAAPEQSPAGGGPVVTDKPRQQRGGLFGRGFFSPHNLGVMGSALRQIGGTPDALNDYLMGEAALADRAARQARQDSEDKYTALQRDDEARQRQQLEELLGSLPEEQRRWAMLNPQRFAELLMQQRMGNGEWEVGSGYTHAFRVRPDGTIEQGGEIPLRPRAPRSGGVDASPPLPDGFVLD